MIDKSDYESLQVQFGIDTSLDTKSRDFAGIYADGKIYYAVKHITAIEQCKADNPKLSNRMTFLHFIKKDNGQLVAFIDCLALFRKIPVDEIVKATVEQCQEVAEIYEYKYPNKIKLLYKAMSLEV